MQEKNRHKAVVYDFLRDAAQRPALEACIPMATQNDQVGLKGVHSCKDSGSHSTCHNRRFCFRSCQLI